MASILTEHVRQFDAEAAPPADVLPAIERLLRSRMRDKGVLHLPPSHLGYPGVTSWSAPGAFEDIVVDCYIFAVLDRLTALRNQLRNKPNVDGLIARNVTNFVIERRRRYDPIGYAVFGTVRAAARAGLAKQSLSLQGDSAEKPQSQTVLRLVSSSAPVTPADPDSLRSVVNSAPGWSEALPHLTETTEEGREWVEGLLRELPPRGMQAVRVGDLVAAIAERVRADWQARHGETDSVGRERQDEVVATVRIVWPDDSLESRERWEFIKRVVPERIARLDRQQRVRSRLASVFRALVEAIERADSTPSQADIIARTGVPRATLSDDFRILRELMSHLDDENPE